MKPSQKQSPLKNETHLVDGSEALTRLNHQLKDHHWENEFNTSYQLVQLERSLLDTIVSKRKKQHLTQKDLAEVMHTKAQQISKYERADQIPTISVLLKLCEALGLELSH